MYQLKEYQQTNSMLSALTARFRTICGDSYVITDPALLEAYGRDQTGDLWFPFDLLIRPDSAAEVAAVLALCNQYKVPVTPRGGGTGVTGGALPCEGGIVLTLERLNRIIEINKTEAYVVAEAGVITETLCNAVEEAGLYFPVQPGSSGTSLIGGNVAENAGSPLSARYGSTARYVLNLEVVLPTGETIWTGANVTKNATGLNLTQLITGSEGLLGVITKVVYRLLSRPNHQVVLSTSFHTLADACHSILAIKRSGLQPAAVELVCNNALQLTAERLPGERLVVRENIAALLLVELHEHHQQQMDDALQQVVALIQQHTNEEILVAQTAQERAQLFRPRHLIGQALTADPRYYYRDIDMAVPVSSLFEFISRAGEICTEASISHACFGHAADGNVHFMLIHPKEASAAAQQNFEQAVNAIYQYGISLGGSISGEHGIGLLQQSFMPLQFSAPHLALMKGIKALFDPNGILNPGKVFQE